MVRPRLLAFSALLSMMLWAPAAHAAGPGSAITSPANGAELFYNRDTGAGTVAVNGTVNGSGWGSTGDLLCLFNNDSKLAGVLARARPITNGSFAFDTKLSAAQGDVCRLAFVPAGSRPTGSGAAPFAGPAISVSEQFTSTDPLGGNIYGYGVLTGTLAWSFEFKSLGECPVWASDATDTASLGSFPLFFGNACLGASIGNRSAIQIDSLNAYSPGAVSNLGGNAGFEQLSYSTSFDANHDTVTINETDPLVICNPQVGQPPPTPSDCPQLRSAGVVVQQTTQLLPGGQVARVRQVFSSSDGRAHPVDLLFSQSITSATGPAPGFEFPGQTSFATHASPDAFLTFPAGPGSIIAVGNPVNVPSVSNPIGAITYSQPPAAALFTSANGSQTATFLMHYAGEVQPGAPLIYNWSFSQTSSAGSLAVLEAVERDRFSIPALAVTRPRNHQIVHSRFLTVTGRAFDRVGISSLTVGGHVVRPAPGGLFSTAVQLHPGPNRIGLRVVNYAGNTATQSLTVIFQPPPCVVPRLRGKTLTEARKALFAAHCSPGQVTRTRSTTTRRGRIISSNPSAGTRHHNGWRVALVVSRGR